MKSPSLLRARDAAKRFIEWGARQGHGSGANDPELGRRELRWMVDEIIARRRKAARWPFLEGSNTGISTTTDELSKEDLFNSDPGNGALDDRLPLLRPREHAKLTRWIEARISHHKPLQYIMGSEPFCGLDIIVRPPILIPRWETEEWVTRVGSLVEEYLLTDNQTMQRESSARDPPEAPNSRSEGINTDKGIASAGKSGTFQILDLCTGTGCISLALAHNLSKLRLSQPIRHVEQTLSPLSVPSAVTVTGVDINPSSIRLARLNQRRHGIPTSVLSFHLCDITSDAEIRKILANRPCSDDTTTQRRTSQSDHHSGVCDLVVSNPPYISPADYAALDPSVKDWEDQRALLTPDQRGTFFHHRIIELSARWLLRPRQKNTSDGEMKVKLPPRLALEIGGPDQVEPLELAMEEHGFVGVEAWKDLAGHERVVVGY